MSRRKRALAFDYGPLDTEGMPHRAKHKGNFVVENIEDKLHRHISRARVYSRNVLKTYFRRNVITTAQYMAGSMIKRLWHVAGLEPRVISPYREFIGGGSIEDIKIASMDSNSKFREALSVCSTQEEVLNVCCFDEPLASKAKIKRLKTGLNQITAHFIT